MFIGRETELRFLNHYYGIEGSQILVVYGQKGVGKTTLIKEFASGYQYSYYHARACSEREQRYQWATELQEKDISVSKYPEYTEIFDALLNDAEDGKKILILDEFHHFVKSDDTFLGQLIQYISKQSKKCMIILCTSAAGWVENSMIQKIGTLASSLSGLLKVRELKFKDMVQIFPEFSKEDNMLIYAALGGAPGLWKSFSPELNAKENIIMHLINKDSRLYREMSVFMAEELREPAVYNTLLASMSLGCTKLNDIYLHTGFSRAKISVYLKNLMELDLVEKMYSFESDGYANTKKGIYRISNPYVRFYFRFLFPYQSKLQELSPKEFYEQVVEKSYPQFVEEAYRRVCREFMAERFKSTGEWIGKTGNLDIVARDEEDHFAVCVCSYARRLGLADFKQLVFHMQQAKIEAETVVMFCEKGFDEELMEITKQANVFLKKLLSD